jgi:hypothetical protein
MNLVKAFIDIGEPIAPGFYSALIFVDQNIGLCDMYSTYDTNGVFCWRCDAGTLSGEGETRVKALEDILRQYLATRKNRIENAKV